MQPPTDQVQAWVYAELTGEVQALDALLHPAFLAVGPFGFLPDRAQWMQRFSSGDLVWTAFTFTPDADTRLIGGSAFVVGTQEQEGTHQDQPVAGAFRVTLVFTDRPTWRLTAAQLSLRTPPGVQGGSP